MVSDDYMTTPLVYDLMTCMIDDKRATRRGASGLSLECPDFPEKRDVVLPGTHLHALRVIAVVEAHCRPIGAERSSWLVEQMVERHNGADADAPGVID